MSEECHHCEDKWYGLATFLPLPGGGGGSFSSPVRTHYLPMCQPVRGVEEIPVCIQICGPNSCDHKVRIYKDTTVYVRSSELGLSQPLSRQ
jgi:hypothetical protein